VVELYAQAVKVSRSIREHAIFFQRRCPWQVPSSIKTAKFQLLHVEGVGPMALKFELGLDFITVLMPTKFHHPMPNRSEVIALTNKQTNKQTNLQTIKHVLIFLITAEWCASVGMLWPRPPVQPSPRHRLYLAHVSLAGLGRTGWL